MFPSGVFVVEGSIAEAAMEAADEVIGDSPDSLVVRFAARSKETVGVESAGGSPEGVAGSLETGIEEPLVDGSTAMNEGDLAGSAGNRSGAGISFTGLRIGVAVGRVAHFREHPGAKNLANAGKAIVDLGRRVGLIEFGDLSLEGSDFTVQSRQDVDGSADRIGVAMGDAGFLL